MRRLGFFAISLLFVLEIFSGSPRAFAALTPDNLAKMQAFKPIFSDINANFGTRWEGMVNSVYNRFKDDPDVNDAQFRKYVLQGIPGATIPDQTGFIPMLNGIINGGGSSSLIGRAQVALPQANQILSNAITAEQVAAGTITQQQAQQQNQNAAATNAAATAAAVDKNVEKTDECGLFDGNLITCIDQLFAWFIRYTILQVAGVLFLLSAQILNISIAQGVLNFSHWAPDSLYSAWIVVRQIVSLAVVFAGLYLGFMYIIGRQDTFNRYIGWLVMFALFVNFSYPITRMLTDVSNIVSLNIYSATVGEAALSGEGSDSAGTMIKSRLGLDGLITVANDKQSVTNKDLSNIRSTPNVLLLVVFVCYAAYVLFMTAGIMILRTILLVMLTVASPLLLVDSVIPKLGDAAAKMRKFFFEQLIVAPVFMILFALTLKFMDVFRSGWSNTASTALTFFNLLMMLVMLHITFKITKQVAGKAGEMATNFMGKVGGFGLAAATGGAGLLARGSLGAAAARMRDSGWMDKMQGSRMGRGLYGISNSLAQSTFDARNIGMVSRGMATAGLTGMGGLAMQQGLRQGAEQRFAQKQEAIDKKAASINDDSARAAYRKQATSVINTGMVSAVDPKILKARAEEAEKGIKEKRDAQIAAFASADPEKRKSMMNQALISRDTELRDRLDSTEQYLKVNNNDPNAAVEKAKLLKDMKFRSDQAAEEFLKKIDPFKDINTKAEDNIKALQEQARALNRNDPADKKKYNDLQSQIGQIQNDRDQLIDKIKKDTWFEYSGGGPMPGQNQAGPLPQRNAGAPAAPTAPTAAPAPSGNTYPVTNTIQQVQGGFIYQGNFYQSMTDAAAAAARNVTSNAQAPTSPVPPAPAPQASSVPPAPRPAPQGASSPAPQPTPAPQPMTPAPSPVVTA
jgi:hypothetical protein